MKQCNQCFSLYEEEYEICPCCGYVEGTPVAEPRYLDPGTVLQQRYLVGVAIGAGGFGVTYAAWDKVLEQKVAIKEYLPGEFSTRGTGQTQVTIYGGEKTEQFRAGKEKFHEESIRLAKFRNIPGIVQIFNSFTENGTVYIVMEYLEGETLDARLKREGRIQEQEAVNIMIPILQALETVHKEGILHRDIAPNNIFLTNEGEVKLLDFGAARSATGSHSKSLTVLYKEGYTPEEQYRSRGDQGPWTDVYACAATLYKMLTGNVPPGALERRRKDTLKEPSKSKSKVSKEVDIAILNALNVDVKYRTKSAGQFLQELTGKVKGKKHFIRTIEKKIGNIPLPLKIGVAVTVLLTSVFLVLLQANVIHFEVDSFGNYLVPEGMSRVPNIVNKIIEEAEKDLTDKNLSIKITDKQFSEEIPKDHVLCQSQNAGTIVEIGTVIEIVVSGGSKNQANGYELEAGETFVPDVQYKSLENALELIEEANMIAEVKYRVDERVDVGKIIEQEPEAGNLAREGDTLTFYVNGVEPESEEEVTEDQEETNQEITEPESPPMNIQVEASGEGFKPEMASELLVCINQYRTAAGVAPLTWNDNAAEEARSAALQWHVNQMASLSGNYVVIGRSANSVRTAQKAVDEWMTGVTYADATIPSYSETLLNPNYTLFGGAMYYSEDGNYAGKKYEWVISLK